MAKIRKKFVYVALDPRDPLELPLAVFDAMEELCEWAGIERKSLKQYLKENARHKRTERFKYIKVLIELERNE